MKKIFLIVAFISLIFNGFSQQSYYNDVDLDLTGSELKNALSTKITQTHTKFLQYTPDIWNASKVTDANPNNTDEVILIYGWEAGNDQDDTNDRTRSNSLQDNGSNESFVWNREHVYPQSLGTPDITTSTIPGQDAHSLRPVDKPTNSSRGNKRFAEGSGNSGVSNDGWYPGDEWKGDVARMMMYMYVRYDDQCLPTNVGIGDSSLTQDDMIDLFLKWNVDDKVSDIEIARNEYHENTSNSAAQGNRNPFIDNPYLATIIWGGNDNAQDLWGISSDDDVDPSQPINVTASNRTTTTIDIEWDPSEDNVGVTGYNIYIDNVLTFQTSNSSFQLIDLTPDTQYAIEIEAKDLGNNKSEKSVVLNSSTTADITAPSAPTNITGSNISGTAFKINWDLAEDDTAATGYKVFVNTELIASTADLFYTLTGLTVSTTYSITVSAKDAADNESEQSVSVNITTTDGSSNGINQLFFSEYVEGGGYNKAIEIVNLTSSAVDLTGYSIKKQSNGAGDWIDELSLNSGSVKSITTGDVFVVINSRADSQELNNQADLVHPDSSPINWNGNDAVGLFKNGVLIDIVGVLGETAKNFADMTLRRVANVTEPNSTYTRSEWDEFPKDNVEDIGSHTSTLSANDAIFNTYKMYPNPTNGNTLYFKTTKDINIKIYNAIGQIVKSENISENKNNIDISNLSKGIFIIKIYFGSTNISKKLIKY
ncbi:endonuclease [Polaribacter sp.]|nr:endonuclease [Polaribacter sp.]